MSEAEAENRTEVTVQGIEGTVSGTWAKRRHTPLADLKASAVDIRVLQDPAADFKVKKTDENMIEYPNRHRWTASMRCLQS